MALKIIWSPRAKKGFNLVTSYLEKEWTQQEILNFEQRLKKLLDNISVNPKMCPSTGKDSNLRKGLIDKNNYIIYRIKPRKGEIGIVNLRGTRQKPIY
jgi:plasmid stabilization system protein ParE